MPGKGGLSESEMHSLKECATEAFFKRSLPLMAVFGASTYIAIREGIWTRHPRWGATPKVLAVCGLGYFLGQISYSRNCRQRLMNIPDSRLGELLRKQEYGIP